MRKTGLVVIAAMALLALSGGQTYAQATNPTNSVNVTLTEQNGSGQNGVAVLTEQDGRLMVSIDISGGTETPQPAHIHRGTCANLDPAPAYPLSNVVNGKSETTLEVGMTALQGGEFAINVHKSAAEASVYVACGDILNMQMGGGTGTGTGEQGGGEVIPPPAGTPEELAATSSPGMPKTGSGTQTFYLAVLALLALCMSGAGLKLAGRKRSG
jgi:LPXTG-motif cell wall-anchored protein